MHRLGNVFGVLLKAGGQFPRHRLHGFLCVSPAAANKPGISSVGFPRLRSTLARHPSLLVTRNYAWGAPKYRPQFDTDYYSLHETEEDATKAAILEKVMKGRQPTELMLRCTILDSEGHIKTVSGQFMKSDLSCEHKLHARDLRKIDSRVPNLVPTILAREEGFLMNILHVRALVKADTVILFDTYGSVDSRLHSMFLYHLEHNLKSKTAGLPYEFRALESILLSVLSALEAELVFLRKLVGGLLAELDDDIDHDRFKRLLHYSRKLSTFQNRAKLVQDALEEVLQQDEDLVAMYLTDKKNGITRASTDHQELEILLESFEKQVEEIVNEAENMQNNIQSTQEIVELILDSNRNQLLALDLKISMATFGVGTGAMIAGIFGMNLTSHIEGHPHAFYVVTGVIAISSMAIVSGAFRRLAKIRKVGLSSTHSSSRRPNQRFLPLPLRARKTGGWWP